jgi:hypothetical protein
MNDEQAVTRLLDSLRRVHGVDLAGVPSVNGITPALIQARYLPRQMVYCGHHPDVEIARFRISIRECSPVAYESLMREVTPTEDLLYFEYVPAVFLPEGVKGWELDLSAFKAGASPTMANRLAAAIELQVREAKRQGIEEMRSLVLERIDFMLGSRTCEGTEVNRVVKELRAKILEMAKP